MIVREYRDEDLADVLSAWESGSAVAHPFLTKEFLEQERFNLPNLYLPNAETWVADDSGQVMGFIALLGNEVGAIFVKAEAHHQGIGRALMDKAHELRGELEVEVFKDNTIGRKFYSSYGFTFMDESIHEQTGNALLRLKYTPKYTPR